MVLNLRKVIGQLDRKLSKSLEPWISELPGLYWQAVSTSRFGGYGMHGNLQSKYPEVDDVPEENWESTVFTGQLLTSCVGLKAKTGTNDVDGWQSVFGYFRENMREEDRTHELELLGQCMVFVNPEWKSTRGFVSSDRPSSGEAVIKIASWIDYRLFGMPPSNFGPPGSYDRDFQKRKIYPNPRLMNKVIHDELRFRAISRQLVMFCGFEDWASTVRDY